ncbi:hypothetical protein AOLI_G00057750 [Acnodon oligacanthus]
MEDGLLCLTRVAVRFHLDHSNFLLSYRGSNIRFLSTIIFLRGVLNVLMDLLFFALHLWDVLFELSVSSVTRASEVLDQQVGSAECMDDRQECESLRSQHSELGELSGVRAASFDQQSRSFAAL